VDGTRTREDDTHETTGNQLDRAPDGEEIPPAPSALREPATTLANGPGTEPADERELDLVRLITDAELAGRETVADALARSLEAHRAARAAGKVVLLRDERGRRH
jgi:hypothetical protein